MDEGVAVGAEGGFEVVDEDEEDVWGGWPGSSGEVAAEGGRGEGLEAEAYMEDEWRSGYWQRELRRARCSWRGGV